MKFKNLKQNIQIFVKINYLIVNHLIYQILCEQEILGQSF